MKQNNKFTLTPAKPEDIEFIYHLRKKTMKPVFKNTIGWNKAEEQKKAAVELTHTRLITLSQKTIGVIKLIPKQYELHLHQIQLLPEYQNKGTGT